MQAIELRAALIAANDININGADALVETSILKQLIESCNARVDELKPEAKALAEEELTLIGATNGKFEHLGHHYSLDKDEVYDIIGDPKKYNTPEAANYRRKAKEQKELKNRSSVLTKEMKSIYDAYPINHPNIEPDSEKTTLKCLD